MFNLIDVRVVGFWRLLLFNCKKVGRLLGFGFKISHFGFKILDDLGFEIRDFQLFLFEKRYEDGLRFESLDFQLFEIFN